MVAIGRGRAILVSAAAVIFSDVSNVLVSAAAAIFSDVPNVFTG